MGLHFAYVEKIIGVLNRVVSAGNSLLVIEYNLDVIKTADWSIAMGPEGEGGEYMVAEGTHKLIANVPESHTGRCIKQDKQTGFVFDPTVTLQQARELMLAQGIDPEDNAFCRLRRMHRRCGATQ